LWFEAQQQQKTWISSILQAKKMWYKKRQDTNRARRNLRTLWCGIQKVTNFFYIFVLWWSQSGNGIWCCIVSLNFIATMDIFITFKLHGSFQMFNAYATLLLMHFSSISIQGCGWEFLQGGRTSQRGSKGGSTSRWGFSHIFNFQEFLEPLGTPNPPSLRTHTPSPPKTQVPFSSFHSIR